MDFIDQIVGPRTGGSSSHIGEGKNEFPLYRGGLWTSCFEVQPELADERFRLVAISGVDIRNIGFGLLFNDDRCWQCRQCQRRHRERWLQLCSWIDDEDSV